ncbi:4'-phosphopantetheinyl transferase family protein [Dactylosporangium cerinum]|uniref:4'-phosphopantetheinyl transferase family protein n=1 Tax=Dactylosporangium cerinum TaxID=1434730 RepID=A0ABV9W5U5_9ACTN
MKVVHLGGAPDVCVAVDSTSDALAAGPVHQADAARAEQLPAWRAAEFLGARALLRLLLAQVEPAARGATLASDPAGCPVLPDWPELSVSLSHDRGHVAAAVARRAGVGIDVQVPPDTLDEAMVRRCLREHATALDGLDDTERRLEFAWVWTVQEACVKAQGTGLAGRPWSIDVLPGQRDGRWGEYRWMSLREQSRTPLSCAYHDTEAGG